MTGGDIFNEISSYRNAIDDLPSRIIIIIIFFYSNFAGNLEFPLNKLLSRCRVFSGKINNKNNLER